MMTRNREKVDANEPSGNPRALTSLARILFGLALILATITIGACGGSNDEIVGPGEEPSGLGVITFTANGENVSIPGYAINFVPIEDTTGMIGGWLAGVSAHFDTLTLFQPNENGPVYSLILFFGFDRSRTFPFTDTIGNHSFGRWDENTLFTDDYTESFSGSMTFTAMSDSTLSGTFEAVFIGDVRDENDNLVSWNDTMNLTNGQFEVPIRNLEL